MPMSPRRALFVVYWKRNSGLGVDSRLKLQTDGPEGNGRSEIHSGDMDYYCFSYRARQVVSFQGTAVDFIHSP